MAKIEDIIKAYPDTFPQIQEGGEKERWRRYEEMREKHSYMCPSCGAKEGELHALSCDMEICPRCGGQLISCGCYLEGEWPPDEERIPWMCKPVICARCGKSWPEPFPAKDWDDVIPPPLREECLCRDCYEKVKAVVLNAEHKYRSPQRWEIQKHPSAIEFPASLKPVLIRALSAWIDLVDERWRARSKRRYTADEEITLAKMLLDKLRKQGNP